MKKYLILAVCVFNMSGNASFFSERTQTFVQNHWKKSLVTVTAVALITAAIVNRKSISQGITALYHKLYPQNPSTSQNNLTDSENPIKKPLNQNTDNTKKTSFSPQNNLTDSEDSIEDPLSQNTDNPQNNLIIFSDSEDPVIPAAPLHSENPAPLQVPSQQPEKSQISDFSQPSVTSQEQKPQQTEPPLPQSPVIPLPAQQSVSFPSLTITNSTEASDFSGISEIEKLIIQQENSGVIEAICDQNIIVDSLEIHTPKISEYAYSGMPMRHVVIRKEVKNIGREAFYDCKNLERIIFEEGGQVSKIESMAFKGCSKLTEVQNYPKEATQESNIFEGCNQYKPQ